MKVIDAEIIISAVQPEQYPKDALPEFALTGRSNVGKSSLINKLIQRKSLARTSSKPGKTQTLNFYLINKSFYFVDLPGYGFAKVPKTEKEKWGNMVEKYVLSRTNLKTVMQIVDLRHPPTKNDQMMFEWLTYHDIPVIVVGTKADKIPKGKWDKHRKIIKETLNMKDNGKLFLFSSETGYGKDQLWNELTYKM